MNIFKKIYNTQKAFLDKVLSFIPIKLRRFIVIFLTVLFSLFEFLFTLLLFSFLGIVLFLQTEYGNLWLTRNTQTLLSLLTPEKMNGMYMTVDSVSFADGIEVKNFALCDDLGTWLSVGEAKVDVHLSDIIHIFTTVNIPYIKGKDVRLLRIPQTREKKPSKPWNVPNFVVPQPLGTIVVESIVIENAFLSADVMRLSEYGLDLEGTISASAVLENKKAYIDIQIQEKNAFIEGTIEYIPKEARVQLTAQDTIWLKTFVKADKGTVHLSAVVKAAQFPSSEEFPLKVDAEGNVDIFGISWLALADPKLTVSTHFIFDGTNVILNDTKITEANFTASVPHFALNKDTMTYDTCTAEVNLKNANVIYKDFAGAAQAKGVLTGTVYDMQAEATLTSENLSMTVNNLNILTLLKNTAKANVNIRIIDKKPDITGSLHIEAKDATFIDTSMKSPLTISTNWQFTNNTVKISSAKAMLEDIEIQSDMTVFLTDLMEQKAALPSFEGKVDVNFTSLALFEEKLPLNAKGKINFLLQAKNRQSFQAIAKIESIDYDNILNLDSLDLNLESKDIFNIMQNQLPLGKAHIIMSELRMNNESVTNYIDSFWKQAEINFNFDAQNIQGTVNSKGDLKSSLAFVVKPFKSEIAFSEFLIDYAKTEQRLSLLKPASIKYGSDFLIQDFNLVLTDKKYKADLFFNGSIGFTLFDFVAKINVPLELLRPYVSEKIPSGNVNADISLKGSPSVPKGEVSLSLKDVSLGTNTKIFFDVNGIISTSSFDWTAELGTKNKVELKAEGKLPLVFIPYPFLSMTAPVTAKGGWKGNVSTLWQFVPLAGRNLRGNGMFDFDLTGSLSNPDLKANAYLSQARFEDKILNFVIAEINMQANLSPNNAVLRLSANDGRPNNQGTLVLNGKLIHEPLDGYSIDAKGILKTFKPLKRDDLDITLSGTVGMKGKLFSPDIFGNVIVNKGVFSLTSFGGTSVSVFDNVEITTSIKVKKEANYIIEEKQESERKKEVGSKLNIDVSIPHNFQVRGMGLESEWKGKLQVRGNISNPQLIGTLSPVRGYFDLLGKRFTLVKSMVNFSGNVATPAYNVVLERKTTDINSLVTLSGVGTRLRLNLTSEPPLPVDEIMARTLFGKSLANLSRFEAIQAAAAVSQLLSTDMNKLDLLSKTRDILGLQVLRIGSKDVSKKNGNDENILDSATLEAGTYLNDNIYVGVEQGIRDTAVRIEIELLPNLSAEGMIGTESSNVGINWKKDY